MNPLCARCGKVVYATEKINCLDKHWHRSCFHCEVCRMPLNMNNYKGYEKKPYCNSHHPKQTFTIVADTPENLHLRQQRELQSQVLYRRDVVANKGMGFSLVLDAPELQRLRRAQEHVSNARYHKDFDESGVHGLAKGIHGHYLVRTHAKPQGQEVENPSNKGVQQHRMQLHHSPGVIVAPVLPGAYYHSGNALGHSYMHQTSMHSLRKAQRMSVFQALYDYTARDTDEVSFRDGDIIHHAQPIGEGWLYGTVQRTGHSGLLPANHLEGIR